MHSIKDTEKPEQDIVEILEQQHVDFFDKISRQDLEEGNYYFLWYTYDEFGCWFEASICNDDTHEIIEVYFGGNTLFYRKS